MKSNEKLIFTILFCTSIIFVGAFSNCQSDNSKQGNLLGEWRLLYDDCSSGETTIIKICDKYIESSSPIMASRVSYIISERYNPDGSIPFKQFDFLHSFDGLNYEKRTGSRDTIKGKLYLEDDIFVLLNYKGGDRSDEYQDVAAFTRKDDEQGKAFLPMVSTVFVLQDGFRGYSWVATEQLKGKAPAMDYEGRHIIEIPENGILETKAAITPVALSKRELEFFFRQNWNNGLMSIPHISLNCLTFLQSKNYTDDEIVNFGYEPDQVYVFYFRYNNPGREGINNIFGKEIQGQVFWFRVDTLRDLLKPKPMVN